MSGARLALGVALLLVAPPAHAAAVRSQGVGRAPIAAGARTPPRAAALDAALRDAVRKVAQGLAGSMPSAAADAALDEAIGPDPAQLVLTYRTSSEQEEATAAGSEIVVAVEAQVDAARLAAALRKAGLLAEDAAPAAGGEGLQRLVLEPAPAWSALRALRQRLVELGAQRVWLSEVAPGRAVLAIEGGSLERLVRAAIAAPPEGLRIAATGSADGAPRIRVDGVPTAPAESAAPIDTPSEKR